MRIKINGNRQNKVVYQEKFIKTKPILKIGAWRDGGFGDSFYTYVVLKAIKKAYPNSNIDFISPHNTFKQVFCNTNFFNFINKNYQDIHRLNDKPLEQYDIWYCLRPMNYSVAKSQLYEHEIYSVSLQRQIEIHGEEFTINPRIAEHKMYGGGRLPAIEVFNHTFNLDANFYDAEEVITNHPDYQEYQNPFKGEYITFHQWGYTRNGHNAKFWPYEYWRELGSLLIKEYGIRIIQIGAPNEIPMGDKIENQLGKTNFFNSCKIIKESKLHIDIEGSLVHVAAMSNIPTICLAGPSMEYWRHNDCASIQYIINNGACHLMPCEANTEGWHKRCCLEHHKCMNELSVDKVFEEIKKYLSRQKI